MFVTNWISTTKIQKISEITNFFRHYFLSRTEVFSSLGFEDERKIDKTKLLIATKVKRGNQLVHPNLIALSLLTINC